MYNFKINNKFGTIRFNVIYLRKIHEPTQSINFFIFKTQLKSYRLCWIDEFLKINFEKVEEK